MMKTHVQKNNPNSLPSAFKILNQDLKPYFMRSFYIQQQLFNQYQMKIMINPDASPWEILNFERYRKQIIDD